MGDCPGPRKETTTRWNVTQGAHLSVHNMVQPSKVTPAEGAPWPPLQGESNPLQPNTFYSWAVSPKPVSCWVCITDHPNSATA